MTDNMDRLLFDIGEEANARVDFDGMYASLLAQKAKQQTAKNRRIRYMGMAAACVIVLGAVSVLPKGLKMNETESPAAPAEYAVETEEAAVAEDSAAEPAPAAEEGQAFDGAVLESAVGSGCDSFEVEEAAPVEEAVEEEAPAEKIIEEESAEKADSPADTGAGGDACLLTADTGVFEIGLPKEGFEEYLKDNYYGIIVIPFEKSGIPEGHADISVSLCENTAVWNTGSGVYYVEIKAVGSADEFAQILREVCR